MARAYSDDLRRKLLEAHERGDGSLAELAVRFGVSRGWAWKISAARRRSGLIERQGYRPGPRNRLDQQVLARLLAEHSDWTLRQLQSGLKKQTGVGFSAPYLWLILKRMNFRLKKSHSTPPSGTRKRISSGEPSSLKQSTTSRRRG